MLSFAFIISLFWMIPESISYLAGFLHKLAFRIDQQAFKVCALYDVEVLSGPLAQRRACGCVDRLCAALHTRWLPAASAKGIE